MDPRDVPGDTTTLDAMIGGAAPATRVSVLASELASALPERAHAVGRRRMRWTATGVLAGILTLGATAAVAAPLLLQPMPGYTELAAFDFGVAPDAPGVRCQTIIGIKPTPNDPRFDAAIVKEFSSYIRSRKFSVPVPDAARRPYDGSNDDIYRSPGFEALSDSYSAVVGDIYARFPHNDTLGHSVMIQDTVSCSGHP